jgi:hypothetical protein
VNALIKWLLSVKQLTKGWTTEGSEFERWYGQTFSTLYVEQTVMALTQPLIQ